MKFCKYHGLGNDYIVINPADLSSPLTPEQIRLICHRNYGPGSDGILLGPLPAHTAAFGVRIFNPDGSEAEKSGNGLRIFCRYLWDRQLVGNAAFDVETAGGTVQAQVLEGGRTVRVEMGCVRFWSDAIPVTGPRREVLNERVVAGGEELVICAATIGNPHCVVVGRPAPEGLKPLEPVSAALARRLGPHLETHPGFPNRTNVQFLNVLDRANLRIEIWERGAGYTLASGSSSSAAAAVAHRLGWCDRNVTVHMPGGALQIEIGEDFSIRMTGPVTRVVEGDIAPEAFEVRPPG